jgi:hypothetical protein
MEIAVSYTRKLNHALYGGNQYESSDFFCSLKMEIPDDEDPKGCHADLSATVKQMVENAVENEILDISGGLSPIEWNQWLQNALQKRWGDVETYNSMSPYQKNIAQMLKKAFKRIKYSDDHASEDTID